MSGAGVIAFPALAGHMGTADVIGLVVSILICGYLLYALLRGERL